MQVSLTSKNIPLTSSLKAFITSKIEKLSKYSSNQLSQLSIVLDVDSKRKGATTDAVVEIIGNLKGKHIAVRDTGSNFYTTFFKAMDKMKTRLLKERRALVH